MHVKPGRLVDREVEWNALSGFVERRQRLAVVHGPRRAGKSFLLSALCDVTGGRMYQAVTGTAGLQRDDFGRAVGGWLGAGALRVESWADAFDRVALLDAPFVVIDELPYLLESSPELAGVVQRYVDSGTGPALVLAGSAMSTMVDLIDARAPLYGRAAAVVVPTPFRGGDLAALWGLRHPRRALWVDAMLGGLPGYRPLLDAPGASLDRWVTDHVLAPSSPVLDAAEAMLAAATPGSHRGLYQSALAAIAAGERTFGGIARVAGVASTALSRPLTLLQRAGLVTTVPDVLRARRQRYELADPHLTAWLSMIAPHRAALAAGRGVQTWAAIADTTWRAQVLGPRWESVVREHVAGLDEFAGTVVGVSTAHDRTARITRELDVVVGAGDRVRAIGETKLRRLGAADVERLDHIRTLLGAPAARLVLASAEGIDPRVAARPDVLAISPADVYGE